MAWNIMIVEKECGLNIQHDFPLMKFYSLCENLKKAYDQEKAELEKTRKK